MHHGCYAVLFFSVYLQNIGCASAEFANEFDTLLLAFTIFAKYKIRFGQV